MLFGEVIVYYTCTLASYTHCTSHLFLTMSEALRRYLSFGKKTFTSTDEKKCGFVLVDGRGF